MLVKFTLLYTLVQLNIVGLPQNCQHLVVHLSHTVVGVLDQLENTHQDLPFVQNTLEAHCVEDERVYTVQHLTDELGIVLLA